MIFAIDDGSVKCKYIITFIMAHINFFRIYSIIFASLICSSVVVPCIGVNPKQKAVDSPISRWIDLHKQLYEFKPGQQPITLSDLKSVLSEMSSLEHTDAYRLGMKPLIESGAYKINYHEESKYLLDFAYNSDVLMTRNKTITDLLLKTLNLESNDCTGQYLNLLGTIHKIFAQIPIAMALKENRELQYENCWQKLVGTLTIGSKTLGSNLIGDIDKLTSIVYQSGDVAIDPHLRPFVKIHRNELNSLAGIIERFLIAYDNDGLVGIKNKRKFQILIENPCKILKDRLKGIMADLYAILYHTGPQWSPIGDGDRLNLNRYTLCNRILAERDTILRLLDGKHKENLNDNSIETTTPNLADLDSELITQQIPFDDELDKIIEASIPDSIDKSRFVVKVDRCVGKTISSKYPTLWSDGKTTYETKKFLQQYWPDQLKAQLKRKKYEYRTRYNHKLAQKSAQLRNEMEDANQLECDNDNDDNDDVDNDDDGDQNRPRKKARLSTLVQVPEFDDFYIPQDDFHLENYYRSLPTRYVTKIERAKRKGMEVKYPTQWSDGLRTMEDEDYLIANWPDQWKERIS